MGTTGNADRTAFHPYFSFKDLVTVYLFLFAFALIIFYAPDKLGRWMAVFPWKREIYYNTICFDWVKVKCTQVINVLKFKLILYLVKIIFTIMLNLYTLMSRKPCGLVNYKGSSETTCVYSSLDKENLLDINSWFLQLTVKNESNKNFSNDNNNNEFKYWLAGLIDGDGSLLVNKNKVLSCEVTVHERDVKALFKIKEKYHGSVLKRSQVKAYRWRVSKRWIITKLYIDLNGKLITDGKIKQLKNFSAVLNIEPIIVDNYNFDITTAWLSGFMDADGSFTIRNTYTLTISISQKTSGVLYSIKEKLECGNVYYDKRGNTFNYAITDLKGIKKMLLYLDKNPLKTTKHIESIIFRKLVQYIELKYHYKNSPNKSKIDHLIKLFKNRNKV